MGNCQPEYRRVPASTAVEYSEYCTHVIDTVVVKKRQLRSVTPEELFAALAKKQISPFATSVLGFTLGSLIDHGASEEEVKALCHLLVERIMYAKENPEIVSTVEKFSNLVEASMGSH
jgi:hypothetical protein